MCRFVSSNLDEFFMVRVAGLLGQAASGFAVRSVDGLTPLAALAEIRERVLELTARQSKLWKKALCPALAEEEIAISVMDDLDADELARARATASAGDLSRADAARRRPRTAVPVHLGPLAQPRRPRSRPGDRRGAIRPREGPGGAPALLPGGLARPPPAARERDRALPRPALPGDGDRRARRLPGHARRRLRGLGRGGRPARGRRARAAPPPLRRRRAARDLELDLERDARAAATGSRRGRRPGLRGARRRSTSPTSISSWRSTGRS